MAKPSENGRRAGATGTGENGRRHQRKAAKHVQQHGKRREHESTSARHFIFCTGIENSYPVITTGDECAATG